MPVYTDGHDWMVAKNYIELATEIIAMYGYDDFNEEEWTECDPNKEFTVNFDPYINEAEGFTKETKTFAEWEEEIGRGFLASTEW